MKAFLKIASINALIFFIVFNAALWLICAANSVYYSTRQQKGDDEQSLKKLPHYAHRNWINTYLQEIQKSEMRYVSFLEWRSKPFEGTAINILPPYGQRRTVGPAKPNMPTVYFFGGSTMWGSGVDDASTIPSQFAQVSGFPSENFGETGYTAHQSLLLLIQLLQDGRRPSIVVFFDGGNDVADKCRTELTPWSHEQEAKMSSALEYYRNRKQQYGLSYLLKPFQQLISSMSLPRLLSQTNKPSGFNCHLDARKANTIAENLIQDWTIAKMLVESFGGEFFAILQPVSFFSRTKDSIDNPPYRAQFDVVYPLIHAKMAGFRDFYDLTSSLDKDEYIYTDFAHLGPAGNKYIAEEMWKIVNGSGRWANYDRQ
jgi:hypothetical protein